MKPAEANRVSADEQAAAQRFLEAERAERGGVATAAQPNHKDWAPLPRRSRPKTQSALLSIRKPISRSAKLTLTVMGFAVPLLVWVLLSATEVVDPTFLPSPVATVAAGWEMAQSGQLFTDLWATVERILYGFGLAILVSVPIGMAIGTFSAGRAFFEPIMSMLRYLPASAFIPLLMIWLGVGEELKIGVLFIGTVFYNTFMTADVVRSVPPQLINVSYTLGARRNEVLRKVIVPHSLPGIIDAIRVNVAAAFNLVVVAEVVASTTGLGRKIMQAQRFLSTDEIFAVLIVIGVCGVLTDLLLRLLRDRVGRWVA
ncbi:ABC transporter permease [Kibdelosporangium phytohabitans]|uniref:ABC transporter permease n=1 Tax=Kibdelosporangium phytohabitans TaxID=860235 RepID=A0A0N9HYB9_9PSEU|nr:ABC transporter permease [Kibdelosporangium phytohabitans]ALG07265.1 ABC transporter permease [Kibdelosporangium phytohabitans]MBE1471875.1 NitT/TauT family transport system permease protein [Kibdelosporangium phytohabitans]